MNTLSLHLLHENTCLICHDDVYEPGTEFVNPEQPVHNALMLSCHHVMHVTCAQQWERGHQKIIECFMCFAPIKSDLIPPPPPLTAYDFGYNKAPEIMRTTVAQISSIIVFLTIWPACTTTVHLCQSYNFVVHDHPIASGFLGCAIYTVIYYAALYTFHITAPIGFLLGERKPVRITIGTLATLLSPIPRIFSCCVVRRRVR